MNAFCAYLRTSIGKKFLVGISGLALSGFLVTHMLGNLLLFVGPQAYNEYAHKLTSNPLIFLAEAGLVLMFVCHIGLVVQLTIQNRAARPHRYGELAKGDKGTCWVARTLILSGLVIFVFAVLHLTTFKWGTVYTVDYNGVPVRDLYTLVVEKFKQPLYVGWYVFSVLVLMAHLSHGVSASLQSLGVMSAKNRTLKMIGHLVALVTCGGFIAQPLYMYFYAA